MAAVDVGGQPGTDVDMTLDAVPPRFLLANRAGVVGVWRIPEHRFVHHAFDAIPLSRAQWARALRVRGNFSARCLFDALGQDGEGSAPAECDDPDEALFLPDPQTIAAVSTFTDDDVEELDAPATGYASTAWLVRLRVPTAAVDDVTADFYWQLDYATCRHLRRQMELLSPNSGLNDQQCSPTPDVFVPEHYPGVEQVHHTGEAGWSEAATLCVLSVFPAATPSRIPARDRELPWQRKLRSRGHTPPVRHARREPRNPFAALPADALDLVLARLVESPREADWRRLRALRATCRTARVAVDRAAAHFVLRCRHMVSAPLVRQVSIAEVVAYGACLLAARIDASAVVEQIAYRDSVAQNDDAAEHESLFLQLGRLRAGHPPHAPLPLPSEAPREAKAPAAPEVVPLQLSPSAEKLLSWATLGMPISTTPTRTPSPSRPTTPPTIRFACKPASPASSPPSVRPVALAATGSADLMFERRRRRASEYDSERARSSRSCGEGAGGYSEADLFAEGTDAARLELDRKWDAHATSASCVVTFLQAQKRARTR